MNNADQLRAIMSEHKLKAKDVAKLIHVSVDTVRSWLVHSGAEKHRPVKYRDIDYLRLKIKEKASD